MSSRGTVRQILTKAGMLFAALFVFTLLLAALPAHRAPQQEGQSQGAPAQAGSDHSSMARMDMGKRACERAGRHQRNDAPSSPASQSAHDHDGDARANSRRYAAAQ